MIVVSWNKPMSKITWKIGFGKNRKERKRAESVQKIVTRH